MENNGKRVDTGEEPTEGKSDEKVPITCDICGKSFASEITFQEHRNPVFGACRYSCPNCDETFLWKNVFESHVKTAHEGIIIKSVYSDSKNLGAENADSGEFIINGKSVSGEVPIDPEPKVKAEEEKAPLDPIVEVYITEKCSKYMCDLCEATFSQNGGLLKHRKSVHKEFRNYSCKQCDQSYYRKTELKRHVEVTHRGERYSCKICDRSYTRDKHLQKHVKATHQGIRYNCKECDRSYTDKTELKYHCDKIHLGIRYNCKTCEKSFADKREFNRHIRKTHNNNIQVETLTTGQSSKENKAVFNGIQNSDDNYDNSFTGTKVSEDLNKIMGVTEALNGHSLPESKTGPNGIQNDKSSTDTKVNKNYNAIQVESIMKGQSSKENKVVPLGIQNGDGYNWTCSKCASCTKCKPYCTKCRNYEQYLIERMYRKINFLRNKKNARRPLISPESLNIGFSSPEL